MVRAKKIFEDEEFRFMKGPSKEKILNSDKSLDEKFRLGCEQGLLWLIEDCVSKGINLDKYFIEIGLSKIHYLIEYRNGGVYIEICKIKSKDVQSYLKTRIIIAEH